MSNRQLSTKRSYGGMQSRRKGSRKKIKCAIKGVDGFRDTIDEPTNSDAATNAPAEVLKEPVNNATSAGLSINSRPFDKPLTNSPAAETTAEMTRMPTKGHSNTETVLHTVCEGTPTRPSIADCFETATSSLPPNEHMNMKRSVLDESGNSLGDILHLERILQALKMQNTDRVADCGSR
ncbi:hypothetical protein LTR66_010236 [Elasticomyces elasticus]|nr:hypothetical protein LTR66_010236 [Elasticomyces elasticus]KAK5011450.1 hypothetical protein LTR28_002776 [Elasticomyces elasticus]